MKFPTIPTGIDLSNESNSDVRDLLARAEKGPGTSFVNGDQRRTFFDYILASRFHEMAATGVSWGFEFRLSPERGSEVEASVRELNCRALRVEFVRKDASYWDVRLAWKMEALTDRFSVVIPAYKANISYLRRCLENIVVAVSQTESPVVDLIVVSDGSPNSAEIASAVDEFVPKLPERVKIRFLHYSENSGVSRARNVGYEAATSNLVFFIDYDDTVHAQYFNLLGYELSHGAEVVGCNMLFGGEGIYSCWGSDRTRVLTTNLFGSGIGLRKDSEKVARLAQHGLYNLKNRYHYEDWELNCVLTLVNAEISAVPLPVYNYFLAPTGRNSQHADLHVRSALETVENAFERFQRFRGDHGYEPFCVYMHEIGKRIEAIERKNAALWAETIKLRQEIHLLRTSLLTMGPAINALIRRHPIVGPIYTVLSFPIVVIYKLFVKPLATKSRRASAEIKAS